MQEDAGDVGLIPGWGRSPGGGNGNPLQYSCLGNPMDGGAWWVEVHEVTELDISEYTHTHTCTHTHIWYLSFSLVLLRMLISSCIHEAANGIILFFFTAEKYSW